MARHSSFRGVFAYPLTPTQKDGSKVDEHRFRVQLFELAAGKKDVDGARKLFEQMFPIIEFVFEKSGVRALHTALEILGRPVGPPRRPIRMLGADDRATLETLLRSCGSMVRWTERRAVSRQSQI